MAREYGRARIALLLCIVPVTLITVKCEIELSGLHLRFLKAEEVSVQSGKSLAESLITAGSQPIDIPRYEFHRLCGDLFRL